MALQPAVERHALSTLPHCEGGFGEQPGGSGTAAASVHPMGRDPPEPDDPEVPAPPVEPDVPPVALEPAAPPVTLDPAAPPVVTVPPAPPLPEAPPLVE